MRTRNVPSEVKIVNDSAERLDCVRRRSLGVHLRHFPLHLGHGMVCWTRCKGGRKGIREAIILRIRSSHRRDVCACCADSVDVCSTAGETETTQVCKCSSLDWSNTVGASVDG